MATTNEKLFFETEFKTDTSDVSKIENSLEQLVDLNGKLAALIKENRVRSYKNAEAISHINGHMEGNRRSRNND